MFESFESRLSALSLVRRRVGRGDFLLVLLALAGAGLVFALHGGRGVLLDWDSVNYISVADSLLAGEGFRQFNGLVYRDWPPLYPLLLAGPGLAGIDPYQWAGWLSALAFALTIFIAGQWLRRRLTSRWLLVWGCLAIALAYPLARQAAFALTETIFILFALLALRAAEGFLHRERRSALLWAGLFTGLALLTRYLGVSLVVAIVLLLALQGGVPLRRRAQHIALYGLLALAPLGWWLLRNYLLLGTLTGRPAYDELTFGETAGQTLGVLAEWAGGSALGVGIAGSGLSWALNGLAAAALLLLAAGVIYGFSIAGRKGDGRADWRPLYVFGLFALVYLILFNVVAYRAAGSAVGSRYILPALLPLLLAGLVALDRFWGYVRVRQVGESGRDREWRHWGRYLLAGALLIALPLWVGWQVFLGGQQIVRAWAGHTDSYSAWADKDLARYLREGARPDSWEWVLSNFPAVAYIYGGRPENQAELPYDILDLTQWMMAGDLGPAAVYVAWFYGSPEARHYRYDDGDLRNLPMAETVAELESGVLLRIRRDAEPGPAYRVNLNGNRLFYRKSPCFPSDANPPFFLHIYPSDRRVLPAARQEYGFAGGDFLLGDFGRREQGRCYMERELPSYPIREIRTGQYRVDAEGAAANIWQDGFRREGEREPLRPARPRGWSQFAAAGN